MEHPVKEIGGVVRTLCQGLQKEQQDAINRYYLPSASFVHPFCRVPSFEKVDVPLVGKVDSRRLIQLIFMWYKTLSPRIHIEIDSAVFDQRSGLLYLSIRQTVSFWFIPFHRAPVRLVTVLHLAQCQVDETGAVTQVHPPPTRRNGHGNSTTNGTHDDGNDDDDDDDGDGGHHLTYAEAAAAGTGVTTNSSHRTRYMIQKQEDLYQTNELLNFFIPAFLPAVWRVWQLMATAGCVVGYCLVAPLLWLAVRLGVVRPQSRSVKNA